MPRTKESGTVEADSGEEMGSGLVDPASKDHEGEKRMKSPKVILHRSYDSNDEGVVFSTLDAAEPFSVRVPHDLLERFSSEAISEPVNALVLERHYDVPSDPVAQSQGQVKW